MALKSAMKAPEASKVYVVRALDKFAPRSKDELEFKKGDLILVVDENAADAKFKGEVIKSGKVKGDKMGWFPTWYVRKEEKEKLPEMPASLMPKKPETEKVKKGVNVAEPTDTSPKPAKAEVEITPRVHSDGVITPSGSVTPVSSDDKLTTAQKRSKFQKIQSIRTLQLKNEEDDEEDFEPEPTEEEPAVSKDNRSEYMKNVASNMVSKMVFMNKKRAPAPVPAPSSSRDSQSRSRSSTAGDAPKGVDSARKENRKSIFASLRPEKDHKDKDSKDKKKETTSSADDVRTSRSTTESKASPPAVAAAASSGSVSSSSSKKPQSAPGSVARSSVTPIQPRTDALSIQQFLAQPLSPRSQSQNPSPSSSTSSLPTPQSAPTTPLQLTNRPQSSRPGVTSSGSSNNSVPEPDSSPDHSQQHSPRLRTGSRSTTDLLGRGRAQSSTPGSSSHSAPESEPSSMGRRSGKTAARAVIVEEDEPVAQSAAVQQFNPEGKNIEIICELGKGATSSVWKGAIDGEFVALKQITLLGVKNPKAMRMALKEEVELMKGFNHPNILKYHAMFYSRVNQEINIVLELVSGVSASKLIGKTGTSEPLAAQLIYQVLEALIFLNRHHIIHRDIKPQNLLVNTEGIVKLIDFGTVARLINGVTHRNSTVGTPWYVAPEVINGERYSYPADMWSIGCSLLEMCTGKPPYHDMNSVAALFKMVEDDHPPLPSQLSESSKAFVLACFQREPAQRITATAALQSPFVALRAPVTQLSAAVRALSTKDEDFVF